MTSHLSFPQLTFLIGGAVLVAIVLIVTIYVLHKSFRRTLKPDDLKPPRVRAEDETGFALAALQGVVAQLKAEQKATQAKLAVAEQRADESTRKIALIAQEMDQGVMVFDRQGFLTQANAPARALLGPDAWSHRRYAELFQSIPRLAELVRTCLQTGAETRKETVEYQTAEESTRAITVSVLPIRDRNRSTEAVVCLLRGVSSRQQPPEA
jgi:PAS domain-containing protein